MKPVAINTDEFLKPSAALYMQQLGRGGPRRFVHAQRARKLRRAGKFVRFHHTSASGRSVYIYVPHKPQAVVIEFSRVHEKLGEEVGNRRYWTLGEAS